MLAAVEVHGRPECLIRAESYANLLRKFRVLEQIARQDGYFAKMIVLEGLTAEPPVC